MKFPTIEEMAKKVTEKALDEYVCEGKTIRQWIEVLKDYDDKKTTLKRVIGRLIDEGVPFPSEDYDIGYSDGLSCAIKIVKEEM